MACVRRSPWLSALLLSTPCWLCACAKSDGSSGEPPRLEDAAEPEEASDGEAADPHESPDASAEDADASQDAGPIAVPCSVTPPTSCPMPPVRYADITPIL